MTEERSQGGRNRQQTGEKDCICTDGKRSALYLRMQIAHKRMSGDRSESDEEKVPQP
jgi:hypothetical protein